MIVTRKDLENLNTSEKLLNFLQKALTNSDFQVNIKAGGIKTPAVGGMAEKEVLDGSFFITLQIKSKDMILEIK